MKECWKPHQNKLSLQVHLFRKKKVWKIIVGTKTPSYVEFTLSVVLGLSLKGIPQQPQSLCLILMLSKRRVKMLSATWTGDRCQAGNTEVCIAEARQSLGLDESNPAASCCTRFIAQSLALKDFRLHWLCGAQWYLSSQLQQRKLRDYLTWAEGILSQVLP